MFSRTSQASVKAQSIFRTQTWPASVNGWIKNMTLAGKAGITGAEVLDNMFPTTEGCRVRGGTLLAATIPGAVTADMIYDVSGASKHFIADAAGIYDATSPADPAVALSPVVSGQSSGEWAATQFSTTGGIFLIAVNGADAMQRYNGSAWSAITTDITGVATSALSYVWQYKQRLFFIEGGTLNAWCLDALAIAGTAHKIALGPDFKLGGELLFGATWSVDDAGDGLNDVCIFVTTRGEVAVYKGTDPTSGTDWSLSGVYRIGTPLGKNAHIKVGGDELIACDIGIVPISQAISKELVALALAAISYPIEEAWRQIVSTQSGFLPFSLVMWPDENMLVVGVPSTSVTTDAALVANARSGAWARYTGWDTRTVNVYDGKLFYGTRAGELIQGEVTGADLGAPYTGVMMPRFSDFGSPNQKQAVHARVTARGSLPVDPALSCAADYDATIPSAPSGATEAADASIWDEAVWNVATWGTAALAAKPSISEWQGVAANGMALAPILQVTSSRTAKPDMEVISLDLVYEVGAVIA